MKLAAGAILVLLGAACGSSAPPGSTDASQPGDARVDAASPDGPVDGAADASIADAGPPDAPPAPMSITVTPATRTLMLGDTQQYVATGTYPGGDVDISAFVVWSTGDPTVAVADETGVVTGAGEGNTTMIADFGGVTGNADVTVGRLGSFEFPAPHCRAVAGTASSVGDSTYWIDPTGSDPFEVYCDMTADGGGWILVSWNGSSAQGTPKGVPYPGHAACPDFSCQRGSSAGPARMQALLQTGTEFAKTQQTETIPTFAPINAYVWAGKYTYGPLATLTMNYGVNSCDNELPYAVGTFASLNDPMPQDGSTVYLSHHLGANLLAPQDYTDESILYYWSVGALFQPCGMCINCPVQTLLGTNRRQAGPIDWSFGAHSVWVR